MSANPDVLYEKLKALPPQRRAEVEDYMDFLARKDARAAALDRLLSIAPALEASGMEPMTDEEIEAEVQAARTERRAIPQEMQEPKGRV